HCSAIRTVLESGRVGETYNIGGDHELTNIDLVRRICILLDDMAPLPRHRSYCEQISFVEDRLGHDFRYAIDSAKLSTETGWRPIEKLDAGLRKTVAWYLDNQAWVESVRLRSKEGGATA